MKFHFSLRAVFVAVTLAAMWCYWHTRPEAIALQFQNAVNAGDYEAADELFLNANDSFISDLGEICSVLAKGFETENILCVNAVAHEQTLSEWLAGTCRIQLYLHDEPQLNRFEGFPVMIVTARGVQKADFDDNLSLWDNALWKPHSTGFPSTPTNH